MTKPEKRSRNDDTSRFEELEQLIKINKHDLDTEWERQSQIAYEVSKSLTEASYHVWKLEHDLEIVRAEEAKDLRLSAAKSSDKITEKAIQESLTLNPDCRKLEEELIRAKYEHNRWQALDKAFNQRVTTLKFESELWMRNYYVSESGGRMRGEAVDRIAAKVNEEAGKLRRQRRDQDDD